MIQYNWELVTSHSCSLGECPVWDEKEKRILWIDILKGEIHTYYPESRDYKACKLAEIIGCIALRKSGGIIAALKDTLALVDVCSGAATTISTMKPLLENNRFNDGKCDPAGRFWVGSMSTSTTPGTGFLYTLESDFRVSVKVSQVTCSNGLAWSPDQTILYYIDTPNCNVVAFDYHLKDGRISDKRVVIDFPKNQGYPDGMTIDEEGMLWVALWDGWRVVRYNPHTGKQLAEIRLPVSKITSCVFGGNTLDDLYITTARTALFEDELAVQPLAGALFVIKNCGHKGMSAFEFGG